MSAAQHLWPYTFAQPNGYRFEISVGALESMWRFRQVEPHLTEAGGILLGRHLLDGSAIIVDAVTTPLPGDRRSRTTFFRGQKRHQAVIDETWLSSNGTCTYLGEWHTHPEPIPTPSIVDWTDWQRRLAADQYSEPIFFVIVGTQHLAVWEGRRSGVLCPLACVER